MDPCYEREAELLKALAHPVRLQIVHGLWGCCSQNVSDMVTCAHQSQSCVSQHLAKLKAVGAVKSERSGNEVYYELDDPVVIRLLRALFPEEERL